MIEHIFLTIIFLAAVSFIARSVYKTFTGKNTGCANCPGNCGQSCGYFRDSQNAEPLTDDAPLRERNA
ncbi:MAG: FeoB-associated Cys-rich membrane protein [Candidatus Vecturithrix sp.]|nr:FeoB-associated Cys-rich membrane protein [Candidatus Vecturithrix sp.]